MKKLLLCLALISSMNVFADLSQKNEALFQAMHSMDLEAIEEALANGADVNAIKDWGDSPLSWSERDERKHYINAIQLFLEQGAKIDTGVGRSICYIAVKHNHIKIIKSVLASGVYVNPQDHDLHTLLREAIEYDRIELVQLLLANGIDINAQSLFSDTALHHAAVYGPIAIAQFLLENGADVNAQDDYLNTPLHRAAAFDNIAIAQLLLENGADVNAKNEYGRTVLWNAIEAGPFRGSSVEMAELLLANGADVNAQNNYGQTALYAAIGGDPYTKGRIKMVELLLDHDMDVNSIVSAKENLTPLLLAVIRKEKEIVKFLLDRGANRKAEDINGRTVYYWAKQDPEITRLLQK